MHATRSETDMVAEETLRPVCRGVYRIITTHIPLHLAHTQIALRCKKNLGG
jgi:hypothetical protein